MGRHTVTRATLVWRQISTKSRMSPGLLDNPSSVSMVRLSIMIRQAAGSPSPMRLLAGRALEGGRIGCGRDGLHERSGAQPDTEKYAPVH